MQFILVHQGEKYDTDSVKLHVSDMMYCALMQSLCMALLSKVSYVLPKQFTGYNDPTHFAR